MTTPEGIPHLTEAERQGAADGTLASARRRAVDAHLSACDACDADVARLRGVIARARASEPPPAPLDALWPDIRARIERQKVVPLVPAVTPNGVGRSRVARVVRIGAGLVAAGLVAALGMSVVARREGRVVVSPAPVAAAPGAGDARLASNPADSSRLYEQEVQTLLDELRLRRALLRPDVAARMDHDVRVIDAAIAELQDALREDPNNPALRQLLAASYRQKRDLLRRVDDAS